LLVSYSESLAQVALESESRLQAHGLPIRDGNSCTLYEDVVVRALWSCRVKVEKALVVIEPNSAVGATQFFLTSEEHTPFSWR
jgi:hypothetical protein